jgi:hypothetical protein
MPKMVVFSFHYVVNFQMQEPLDLEENTKPKALKIENKLQMDKSKAKEETNENVVALEN